MVTNITFRAKKNPGINPGTLATVLLVGGPCAEPERIPSVPSQRGGPLCVLNPKADLLYQDREEALCAELEKRVSVQVYNYQFQGDRTTPWQR